MRRTSALVLWLCAAVTTACAASSSHMSDQQNAAPESSDKTRKDTKHTTALPRVVLLPKRSTKGTATASSARGVPASFTRSEIQRVLSRGPGRLLQSVRVKPSLKGNKFLGFQILWMSTDQPRFRAPFLHVGDIILQVNGIRMGRPEDYLAAFEALKTAQKVSFDIWRKDERLLIDYPIVEQ